MTDPAQFWCVATQILEFSTLIKRGKAIFSLTKMSLQSSPLVYRRTKWRLVDKLRIADSAVESGWIKRTARIEGTAPKNVRRWIGQRDQLKRQVLALRNDKVVNKFKLLDLPKHRPIFGAEVDKAILEYYRELRSAAAPVSVRILVQKWIQLDPGAVEGVTENARRFRMYRFMRRHDIVRRSVTHHAQNKFASTAVINDFVEYINIKLDLLGITWDAVANFDETNVYFAPEIRYTLADRGSKTVTAKKANSSNRCTTMIGCTATGKLLPPFVIWKGSTKTTGRILRECEDPVGHGLAEGITYTVQEKAWMDEARMLQWVDTVWKPFADSVDGPTMLILDECSSHLTAAVKERIAACNTELEYIPGGYTSKLQVMDVGLNKPFKDRIRHCVESFIVGNPIGTKPTRATVSHWIKTAWTTLDIMTVQNTWRHIGFTEHGIHVQRVDIDSDFGDDDTDSEPEMEDPIALLPVPPESDMSDDEEDSVVPV